MLTHRCALICFFLTPNLAFAQARSKGPPVPAGVTAERDLSYLDDGHERQTLDLYLPEMAVGKSPLVIWIHGGAWKGGSKESCPALFLTTQGYAVASINYRLSQQAKFPAQIHDCKAAVRWLRRNAERYRLDPERFATWGSSAGGHLAALLGTSGDVAELEGIEKPSVSSRVQCVVDWFGPTDFLQLRDPASDRTPEAELVGGRLKDKAELVRLANPITHLSDDDPPFLVMHGDKDNTVAFEQSKLLADALAKRGITYQFVPLRGAGHGGPQFQSAETLKQVEAFLAKYLDGGGRELLK